MRTPDDVSVMLRLHRLGWGLKRIASELGCSRNTVRRYLSQGGWQGCRSALRPGQLEALQGWLAERFWRHRGNADVLRQELLAEQGLAVSLRTVERSVAPLRRELRAAARATVRFETPPGRQLQIDFGERRTLIEGGATRVYLFVATLGYSRRLHVRVFRHERQECWFDGMESAFRAFGGSPEEVLLDNARALVDRHDAQTREVAFNAKFLAFAKHWHFRPGACAPYRARTKGKDERGVGYVKSNAIAGRSFASWSALEGHLDAWTREVADVRIHGTTGEAPMVRFCRDEARALRPIGGMPPFHATRELIRRVQSDCVVEVEGNAYSVPWRLIGESVGVAIMGEELRISHAGREVAIHQQRAGRRQRAIDPAHFEGVAGSHARATGPITVAAANDAEPAGSVAVTLLRPLAEYEAVAGGNW
ncbi:MAG: IS21 family transposase [Acetobacteraceae bacterium]